MNAALRAGRMASSLLYRAQSREAAWWALYALELDRGSALGWAVAGRIVLAVAQDSLGTLATQHATQLGLPDPERATFTRHHKVDLWSRGLLEVRGGAPIARVSEIEHAAETGRLAPWLEGQAAEWGGMPGALEAARRMLGAFADAYQVPEAGADNPLRHGGWADTPAFAAWKAGAPLSEETASEPHQDHAPDATVLSDYWMEQEVLRLAAGGGLEQALERAELWSQLRPDRLRPLAALLRLTEAAGQPLGPCVARILATGTKDLNELEEARVALGELRLWEAQRVVLERMLTQAPDNPVVLANLGVAEIELGDAQAGAATLERALAHDADNAPALANLGLLRMREGNYVAARPLLERAAELAPDQAIAHIYLGACRNNQGERAAAIESLERALALEPSNEQARQLLGELRALLGRAN